MVAAGSMTEAAMAAAVILEEAGISTAVMNARSLKPFDEALFLANSRDKKLVVSLEENVRKGGFNEEVACCLEKAGLVKPLLRIGIEDSFVEHGPQSLLREIQGLSPEAIARQVRERLGSQGSSFARALNLNRRRSL